MTRARPAERYWPLVRSLARKIHAGLPAHPDVTIEDLEQHGHVGLLEAAQRYDAGSGVKFSTFAYLRIRGAIYNSLRNADPRGERLVYRYRELARTRAMLAQLLGRTPTPIETAEALGITHAELAELERAYWQNVRAVSIDTPTGQDATLADSLAAPDADPADLYVAAEAIADVRRRVANLSDADRNLIALYYGEGYSYAEIATQYGVSKPLIQQRHNAALERLRADAPTLTEGSS